MYKKLLVLQNEQTLSKKMEWIMHAVDILKIYNRPELYMSLSSISGAYGIGTTRKTHQSCR